MSKNSTELTLEQEQLIQHLTTGKSYEEASKLLGISSRTAKRWMDLPHVQEAYQSVRQAMSAYVRDQIKALSTKAIKALEDSLTLEEAPTVRLKAAQLVLDRVAPEEAKAPATPLQGSEGMGVLVSHELIPYLAPEEMATIESYIALAEQRKVQAENEREMFERKRG